jgi:hypothetical protein
MTGFEIGTVSLKDAEAEILPSVCPFARREGILGSGGVVPLILNVGTRWGEWSALRLASLAPRKERYPFNRSRTLS